MDRRSRIDLSGLDHFGHQLGVKLSSKPVEEGRCNLVIIGLLTATPCMWLTVKRQIGGSGSRRTGYVLVVIIGCCGARAALLTCRRACLACLAEGCGLKELRVGRGHA